MQITLTKSGSPAKNTALMNQLVKPQLLILLSQLYFSDFLFFLSNCKWLNKVSFHSEKNQMQNRQIVFPLLKNINKIKLL